MFVFNGLGSKGASLGPYFARQMAEFMVSGKPVLQSVNIAGRQS
jgi:glycine/D-amino acid oxidase-like deaminating enzyme